VPRTEPQTRQGTDAPLIEDPWLCERKKMMKKKTSEGKEGNKL
jgi:hypothetical protein